mmetsp:Transcript_14952/g.24340  ORF Transcript_14952/g.24340 Transcript_14952/m.24340 type:complete len:403 (+) Transcript_14952:120-1328(+)
MGAACYRGRGGYGSQQPPTNEGDDKGTNLDRKQKQKLLYTNNSEQKIRDQTEGKNITLKDERGQKEHRMKETKLKGKSQLKEGEKVDDLAGQCQVDQTNEIEDEIIKAKKEEEDKEEEKEERAIRQKENEQNISAKSEVDEQAARMVAAAAACEEARRNTRHNVEQVANEEGGYMAREKEEEKAGVGKEEAVIVEKREESPRLVRENKTMEMGGKAVVIAKAVTMRSEDTYQEATKKEIQALGEKIKMEHDLKKVVKKVVATSRKKDSNTTSGVNAGVSSTTPNERSQKKKIKGGKVGRLGTALNLNALISRGPLGSSRTLPVIRRKSNTPSGLAVVENNTATATATATIEHYLKPKMARRSRSKSQVKISKGTLKQFSPEQTWLSSLEQSIGKRSARTHSS